MQIDELGLAQYWLSQVETGLIRKCTKRIEIEMKNIKKNKNIKKPLTLKGLSGAFLVLVVGSLLAIAAFIVELLNGYIINKVKLPKTKQQHQVTSVTPAAKVADKKSSAVIIDLK